MTSAPPAPPTPAPRPPALKTRLAAAAVSVQIAQAENGMVRRLGRMLHTDLILCLAIGSIAAQGQLALMPEMVGGAILATGARWALATYLALIVARVCRDVVTGSTRPWPAGRWTAMQIGTAGAVLIAVVLLRTPSRMIVNLLGYALVALPLWWLVRRRSGSGAAAQIMLAVTLFVLWPTHLTAVPRLSTVGWDWQSTVRWSVGFPSEAWALRHVVRLPRPHESGSLYLMVPLAEPYQGQSRITARINGEDPGQLLENAGGTSGATSLWMEVAPQQARGTQEFTIELRQHPVDGRLRLIAQRWVRGASSGVHASSYFDGERWWPGTFHNAANRRLDGVYLIFLATQR